MAHLTRQQFAILLSPLNFIIIPCFYAAIVLYNPDGAYALTSSVMDRGAGFWLAVLLDTFQFGMSVSTAMFVVSFSILFFDMCAHEIEQLRQRLPNG